MAKCIAYNLISAQVGEQNVSLQLTFDCFYYGNDVTDGNEHQNVDVIILENDTPSVMKTKISTALISRATSLGASLVANNILMPSFQRG